MEMSKELANVIHDCFVDIYGIKPTQGVLESTYKVMPDELKKLATEWGGYDTEVQNQVLKFMEEKAKIF